MDILNLRCLLATQKQMMYESGKSWQRLGSECKFGVNSVWLVMTLETSSFLQKHRLLPFALYLFQCTPALFLPSSSCPFSPSSSSPLLLFSNLSHFKKFLAQNFLFCPFFQILVKYNPFSLYPHPSPHSS